MKFNDTIAQKILNRVLCTEYRFRKIILPSIVHLNFKYVNKEISHVYFYATLDLKKKRKAEDINYVC